MQYGKSIWIRLSLVAMGALVASAPAKEPFPASAQAIALDQQLDYTSARLIVVQHDQRYKTLDSFARETISAMYGQEHFPGLTPIGTLLEWLFNRQAYADLPVVKIKELGLRLDFSTSFPDAERRQIVNTRYMTPKQFADPQVLQRMRELEPRFEMVTAMRRVREAQATASFMDLLIRVVPSTEAENDAPWHTPDELVANLPPQVLDATGLQTDREPILGLDSGLATEIFAKWASLRQAWLTGDAARVQQSLDALAVSLPKVAGPGVYPQRSQRWAEAHYYQMGKFTWGWLIYFVGAIVSVWAMVTPWRVPRVAAVLLLIAALGLHAYGVGLRWYILGRIPVANMFEAVVASAWIGIVLALLAEWAFRTRVYLFAGHATGFFALIMAGFVIPGGGTLTSLMGILDDIMLRIHTVLIIASYALIFVGAMIAIVYLFGYYFHTAPANAANFGLAASLAGGLLALSTVLLFARDPVSGELVKIPLVVSISAALATVLAIAIGWLAARGRAGMDLALKSLMFVVAMTLVVGDSGFVWGVGTTVAVTGALLTLLIFVGVELRRTREHRAVQQQPGLALAGVGGALPELSPRTAEAPTSVAFAAQRASDVFASEATASPAQLRQQKPILAGAMPGDEGQRNLPSWLHKMDWSHLIILNLVFVMLFVGTILGAVWADYSWGRPWGWDPKEVFALNTWIIYAVIIHVRFVTKNRGLWTAWLSVAGCLMMAFNWAFVNFFIVGLHSYA